MIFSSNCQNSMKPLDQLRWLKATAIERRAIGLCLDCFWKFLTYKSVLIWITHYQGFSVKAELAKNFLFSQNATLTKPIITGTSTSGPITAAKACPDEIPNTATATAIASSKLLLAAVKESVTVFCNLLQSPFP